MRNYLIGWAATVLVLLSATLIVNYLVDPYAIYLPMGTIQADVVKPRALQQGALSKRAGISRMRPRSIVLGNSRAEIGFDPRYHAWPTAVRPIFNAALPATDLRSNVDMLRHAVQLAPPLLAIVGIEFQDFLTPVDLTDRRGAPQIRTESGFMPRRVREAILTLLSLDALTDSLMTLQSIGDQYPVGIRADGFNPLRNYEGIANRQGYYTMFRQRDAENARSYIREPHNIFVGDTGSSPEFAAFKELLELARKHNIELKLLIYPYHAHLLEIFQASGLWPVFEQWKTTLVEMIAREAAESGGQPHVLWDFSGYHNYAAEKTPAANDTRHIMRWYWEAGHFKRELGDLVLNRVLEAQPQSDALSFGKIINRDNITLHLAALRDQARQYADAQPEVRVEMASLVKRSTSP